MPLEITDCSNILNELNKAVKMHNFYPDGHPNYESAITRCLSVMQGKLGDGSELKLTVDQRGFYLNKVLVSPVSQDVTALAKKLFFRRIKEITFTPRVALADMKALMEALKLEPEELQARGGAETLFAERDVYGILLNALKYEDIKKLKKELEEKKAAEAKAMAEAKEREAEKGEAAEEKKAPPPAETPPAEAHQEQDKLDELISRIKKERDFLKYRDFSIRIKEVAERILNDKAFDSAFSALVVFAEHSDPSYGLAEDIRQAAADCLRSILNRDMIKHLVVRVGAKEETFRLAIQKMLLFAGRDAVENLLDAIIEAPEAITRRHLFNTLVLFGKGIRPMVESRIKSPEWYVVRQMVSLLGELGDPQALDSIEAAYDNPDPRVKKEVMKTLVKIPSVRSTAFLIKVLDEQDQGLVSQAIISLGVLKDPASIETLGKIALRREPFADTQEAKREAIKALGIIGDPSAIPYLTNVLFKKVWFGKKSNEEIRSLAAYSLGMIGGDEAFGAIEEAGRSSEGELYITCKRILEGRGKSI